MPRTSRSLLVALAMLCLPAAAQTSHIEDGVAVVEGIFADADAHAAKLREATSDPEARAIVDLSYIGSTPAPLPPVSDAARRRAGAFREVSDAAIAAAVRAALVVDPRVRASDVRVSVRNANVRLEGTIPSLRARAAALADATRARGAARVDDALTLAPAAATVSDAEIVRRVRGALRRAPGIDDGGVILLAGNGRVTLVGHVAEEYQRRHALRLARAVAGVEAAEDRLVVRHGSAPATLTSARLTEALAWSREVDTSSIHVSVREKSVAYDGYVATEAERTAAERIARELGALDVRNGLRVGPPPPPPYRFNARRLWTLPAREPQASKKRRG